MKRSLVLWLALLLLATLTMGVSASSLKVGYLWSEYNASRYNWLRQDMAIETLELFGIKCDKLSDGEAKDVNVLLKYDVITASTVYTLPDDVINAILEYVKKGGKVVWGDAPTVIQNLEIARLFGFTDRIAYCYYMKNARFIPTDKNKLDFSELSIGNGAANAYIAELADTAEVWMIMQGPMALPRSTDYQERSIPGIIVNRYGKGIAMLLNWSVFATGDLSVQSLYPEAILWIASQ